MATILSLIQDFCRRRSLPVPSAIQGITDDQLVQYIGIVNKTLEDITQRFDWQALAQEAVFTTVNAEVQGTLNTLAPNYIKILNETIWNRTLRLPLFGPKSAKQWQFYKALPNSGPLYKYRIRGNKLLFNPPPPAGHTCAFEYQTNLAVFDNDTAQSKATFTKDSDTLNIDETAFLAGFEWNWLEAKGLDYAEAFRRYESFIVDDRAADGTKKRIDMGSPSPSLQPGIFVPAGNWMQP